MDCGCGPTENSGLGQLDVSAVGDAFSFAIDAWNNLLAALGVGAGRREADVITPLQNKVVDQVIAPVFAYLDAVVNHGQTPDCNEIRLLAAQVDAAQRQWLNYLHTTQWSDGRAAQQAEATLAPYFSKCVNGLQDLITKDCSAGVANTVSNVSTAIGNTLSSLVMTPTGGPNWAVIALGVGAVWFLTRRK